MTLGQPVSNLGLGKPNKERAWPIVKFLLSMQFDLDFGVASYLARFVIFTYSAGFVSILRKSAGMS